MVLWMWYLWQFLFSISGRKGRFSSFFRIWKIRVSYYFQKDPKIKCQEPHLFIFSHNGSVLVSGISTSSSKQMTWKFRSTDTTAWRRIESNLCFWTNRVHLVAIDVSFRPSQEITQTVHQLLQEKLILNLSFFLNVSSRK